MNNDKEDLKGEIRKSYILLENLLTDNKNTKVVFSYQSQFNRLPKRLADITIKESTIDILYSSSEVSMPPESKEAFINSLKYILENVGAKKIETPQTKNPSDPVFFKATLINNRATLEKLNSAIVDTLTAPIKKHMNETLKGIEPAIADLVKEQLNGKSPFKK